MPPEESHAAHLWDSGDACRAVLRFARGKTIEAYLSDEVLQAAIERKIEIIGEAANHLSEALKLAHPAIPWRRIVGQRHVLVRDRGKIKQDRLWNVISVHLPDLLKTLAPLVPPTPGPGD